MLSNIVVLFVFILIVKKEKKIEAAEKFSGWPRKEKSRTIKHIHPTVQIKNQVNK